MKTQFLALAIAAFAGAALPVAASVLNVPGNYPTIQAAIDAAGPGDTVRVANGTYSGAGNFNIDTLGKAITVQGAGGAAYMFLRHADEDSLGWIPELALSDPFGAEGVLAGRSVALQGERAAIGAPGLAQAMGGLVMFSRGVDIWEHALTATPDDGAPGDEYGRYIALEGTTLLAGAPLHDNGPIADAGAVYPISLMPCEPPVCYPDFTEDGALDLFDFLGYVNSFNAGETRSDCTRDGTQDLFDFLCYVNAFNTGC